MKNVKIKSIRCLGKGKVRNLTVKKNHTFITKNGIITHNCDSLTSGLQGSQKILRQLMEDVHNVTRFVLLANYEHNIIPELKSRCSVIPIVDPPGKEIMAMCERVLKSEGVKYDQKTLVGIIKKCYPDIRKIVYTLQENTNDNILSTNIKLGSEEGFNEVLKAMVAKDPEKVRSVLKSYPIDYPGLYEYIFDNVGEFKVPASAILEIGEHSYRDNIVAIKEINFIHMVVSMLSKGII